MHDIFNEAADNLVLSDGCVWALFIMDFPGLTQLRPLSCVLPRAPWY